MARSRCFASRCAYAFGLAGFLLACGDSAQGVAESPPPSDADGALTTADYIERFVQYVHWPAERTGAPWHVCGGPASSLKGADYAGRVARGRSFHLTRVEEPNAAHECNILDLTGSTPADAGHFLDAVRGAPILTVGTGPAFCSAGGIICFLPAGPRSFEINVSAVKRAGLVVNARLLNLGRSESEQTRGSTP
jgi:hypothetical protein